MASATETGNSLFVMGPGGSFKFALHGLVDIRPRHDNRLGGSLFGIQLGAMGTTYVKPFIIKMVNGCHNGHRAFQPGANGSSIYGSVGLIVKTWRKHLEDVKAVQALPS